MTHVLYNPTSNNNKGLEEAQNVKEFLKGEVTFTDSATVDIPSFIAGLEKGDKVVLCGGDGTVNKFVNDLGDQAVNNDIFYFATGTGNDFMRDVKDQAKNNMVKLNPYIKDLPTVTVNGITKKFINGIGYGIDGYCCEMGDIEKEKHPGKPVNYAGIAISGLMLFKYQPKTATIIVDGVEHTFKNAWIVPSMNGRYYGGGMNVAPAQDRLSKEKTLSCVIMHGRPRIKVLLVFKDIFTGTHIKSKSTVSTFVGHEITVKFDRPTALQIDGETVLDVTSYTVRK